MINGNRVVLIEDLLKIARRQTGAELLAIENIIDRLIAEKVIIPGTRITKEIILRNKTRRQIYLFIKEFPGVNINTIKNALNLGTHSARWHISVLVKFGCIKEVNYKATTLFALMKFCRDEILFENLYRKELISKLIQTLASRTLRLKELEDIISVQKTKILYNLSILLELTFVDKSALNPDNLQQMYCLSDLGKSLYLRKKNMSEIKLELIQ